MGKKGYMSLNLHFNRFCYVLVKGIDKVYQKDFEGVVLYTDLEKTIECETDKKINQLIKNSYWGKEEIL